MLIIWCICRVFASNVRWQFLPNLETRNHQQALVCLTEETPLKAAISCSSWSPNPALTAGQWTTTLAHILLPRAKSDLCKSNRCDDTRKALHKEQGNTAFLLSGKGGDTDRLHTRAEIPPGTSYFNSRAWGSDCACTAHSVLLKQPYLGGSVWWWVLLLVCFSFQERFVLYQASQEEQDPHHNKISSTTTECCFEQEANPGHWEPLTTSQKKQRVLVACISSGSGEVLSTHIPATSSNGTEQEQEMQGLRDEDHYPPLLQ